MASNLLRVGVLGGFCGGIAFCFDEIKTVSVGGLRFGRAACTVVSIITDYRQSLFSQQSTLNPNEFASLKSLIHQRSAEKLLELCCINGGSFIKVGQHLGSLDYLLPHEYVNTLKILHSKAPKSPLKDIYEVIRLELKREPTELFKEFDPEPIGAASLAQVHKARLKDGMIVAVKVQHPSVLDHSNVDLKGMEVLVNIVSWVFPDFRFQWLVEEMKKNLPLELNFANEARNAEKVALMLSHFSWLKVPSIYWTLTTSRVLTMEFCEGGQVNDLDYIKAHNIDTYEVSEKLGDLYSEMIFVNGHVHCDPHPGNLLVHKEGSKTKIILLDHGLYVTLTENFKLSYGKLWRSILDADLKTIEKQGRDLGLGDLFGLFACMVTARSWDSITKGIDKKGITSEEQDTIKEEAAKYIPEITEVLNRVPRQMILIFKTNDLLRGIEYSLNTNASMKSFISMSRCCIRAVYNQQRKFCSSRWCSFRTCIGENVAQLKLSLYSFYLWMLRFRLVKTSILQFESFAIGRVS